METTSITPTTSPRSPRPASREMAGRDPEPPATRRHLADRSCSGDPAAGRRYERVLRDQMGLPASPAEATARHQLSFRGTALPGRPLSGPSVVLLRVHRDEIAEDEVE